ncbi:MAG: hypothetical protein JNL01_08805 [Bdellovibrionales bacterium]|nr:hypothetical protein [Bdellovibrionales bacterium]
MNTSLENGYRWVWPAAAIVTVLMATLASGCGVLAESERSARDPQFSCEGQVNFDQNVGFQYRSSLDSILNGAQLDLVQSEVFVRIEDTSVSAGGSYAEALVVDAGSELKSTCRAQLNEKTGTLTAKFPSRIEKTQSGQSRLTEVELETTFLRGQLRSELREAGYRSVSDANTAGNFFPGWTVRKIYRSELNTFNQSLKWVFVLDQNTMRGADRSTLSLRVTYQQRPIKVLTSTNCADLTGTYSTGTENFHVYQTGCQEVQFQTDAYEINDDYSETVKTNGELVQRVSSRGTRYMTLAFWEPTSVSNRLTIIRSSEFERGIGSSTTEVLSLEHENCQGVATRERLLKRTLYRGGKKTNCTIYR